MNNSREIIAEVKRIEFIAKWIWPLLRIPLKKHLSQRCTGCICSEQYTEIGKDGLCSTCREESRLHKREDIYKNKDQESMQQELDMLLREYESRKSPGYDALVCFSGGKDSTYLLNRITQEYPGLRLLVFTVDTCFMSPVALDNIEAIIRKFETDHVVFKPAYAFTKKMYRYAFTHLNEKGCSGTVDQFEGDMIFDIARNYAAGNGIPLVIGGISPIQVEQNVGITWFETPREMELSKRENVAGIRLHDIFSSEEMEYWWDGARYPAEKVPRVIFPYYAWGYSEADIRREVVEKGFIPAGNDSPLLTNSQLIPLMSLVDNARFGYSSFEPEFSKLVRAGKADRKFWQSLFEMAEYSAKTGKFIKKSVDDILCRLDLTRSEVGLAE
ncbi:hypothetical protein ACFL6F_00845 [Planctomycetota bacterium]